MSQVTKSGSGWVRFHDQKKGRKFVSRTHAQPAAARKEKKS